MPLALNLLRKNQKALCALPVGQMKKMTVAHHLRNIEKLKKERGQTMCCRLYQMVINGRRGWIQKEEIGADCDGGMRQMLGQRCRMGLT